MNEQPQPVAPNDFWAGLAQTVGKSGQQIEDLAKRYDAGHSETTRRLVTIESKLQSHGEYIDDQKVRWAKLVGICSIIAGAAGYIGYLIEVRHLFM